jgi:hypothetical protein
VEYPEARIPVVLDPFAAVLQAKLAAGHWCAANVSMAQDRPSRLRRSVSYGAVLTAVWILGLRLSIDLGRMPDGRDPTGATLFGSGDGATCVPAFKDSTRPHREISGEDLGALGSLRRDYERRRLNVDFRLRLMHCFAAREASRGRHARKDSHHHNKGTTIE